MYLMRPGPTINVGGGAAEDLDILTLANIFVTDCRFIL